MSVPNWAKPVVMPVTLSTFRMNLELFSLCDWRGLGFRGGSSLRKIWVKAFYCFGNFTCLIKAWKRIFCVSYWFNCFSGMTDFLPLTIVNLSLRLGTNQAMPLTIYCCSNSCSRCLKREPLNLINVEFVKESRESNDLPRHPSRNLTLNFWDYLKPNFEMPYSSQPFQSHLD